MMTRLSNNWHFSHFGFGVGLLIWDRRPFIGHHSQEYYRMNELEVKKHALSSNDFLSGMTSG